MIVPLWLFITLLKNRLTGLTELDATSSTIFESSLTINGMFRLWTFIWRKTRKNGSIRVAKGNYGFWCFFLVKRQSKFLRQIFAHNWHVIDPNCTWSSGTARLCSKQSDVKILAINPDRKTFFRQCRKHPPCSMRYFKWFSRNISLMWKHN